MSILGGILGGGSSGGGSSTGPQEYTGSASGSGLNLQGSNKNVNTGSQTTAKSSTATKDIGNVTIKAAKGSTVNYQPAGSSDQSGVLASIGSALANLGSGGGGGGGIIVTPSTPASQGTLATTSTFKWLIAGAVLLIGILGWKFLTRKPASA